MEINLRQILREYVVGTVAATVVQIVATKIPEYSRRVAEERERKRIEYESRIVKSVVGEALKEEMTKYRGGVDEQKK